MPVLRRMLCGLCTLRSCYFSQNCCKLISSRNMFTQNCCPGTQNQKRNKTLAIVSGNVKALCKGVRKLKRSGIRSLKGFRWEWGVCSLLTSTGSLWSSMMANNECGCVQKNDLLKSTTAWRQRSDALGGHHTYSRTPLHLARGTLAGIWYRSEVVNTLIMPDFTG